MSYESYKERAAETLRTCKEEMRVQPILFFGSGMSQRYANTPTWLGLLDTLCEECPEISLPISYFLQQHESPIDVGTELAGYYRNWAWKNQDMFPPNLFEPNVRSDAYIKHYISEFFSERLNSTESISAKESYAEEIELLKKVKPYSVITTNYDQFLEGVFDNFTPIIGQEIIRNDFSTVGEIIKMHGCASKPESLVFSRSDYVEFANKKKYLSAKLLTYFAEHPVIVMGYSAQDDNVRSLLADIDEIISRGDDFIPNVFVVEFNSSAESSGQHRNEALIPISNARSLRVNCIVANDFSWIYEVLGENQVLEDVNPKVLRAVMARFYKLVRHDIPTQSVQVNFKMLEQASSEEGFATLFGVTNIDDPSAFNASFPFSLSEVGQQLGYGSWHNAHKLIKQLEEQSGEDVKASDNKYHVAIRTGRKLVNHKYSRAMVELLEKVRDGEAYDFKLT